mgnify:CR=1 FL=1
MALLKSQAITPFLGRCTTVMSVYISTPLSKVGRLVKVRFRTRHKSQLVNKSQCYLYHVIVFKSREVGVKIGLSELFGVLGLLVGFRDWRQTARNAFTIGL